MNTSVDNTDTFTAVVCGRECDCKTKDSFLNERI